VPNAAKKRKTNLVGLSIYDKKNRRGKGKTKEEATSERGIADEKVVWGKSPF